MEGGLILSELAIYDYKAIKREIMGIYAETKILLSMLMHSRTIIKSKLASKLGSIPSGVFREIIKYA